MSGLRDRVRELRKVPAGELRAHAENWRTHPARQRQHLHTVIDRVGFAVPVIAFERDGELVLIDGHLRVESVPADQEIPVVILDVTEAEARELLLSVDPLAAMAETDQTAIRQLMQEIDVDGSAEMTALLADIARRERLDYARAGLGDPDAVPEEITPRVERGELWRLGDHQLLCGDATNGGDVERLLAGAVPNLMVTDSPYGVNYDPAWRDAVNYAPNRRRGEMLHDDRADWRAAYAVFPGNLIYAWHASTHVIEVAAAIDGAGFERRAQIIWMKPQHTFGRGHYHWQHEPCWYAVRRGSTATWIGDRFQTTVWQIEPVRANREQDDADAATEHGAQKPVECMERPLRNHEGDVYDPFVGSGTTIIAAQRQGRRCFAMDIDPAWCDVAIARWESFSGETAVRVT